MPRRLRTALVAMPWPAFDMPSPALGALAAHVRAHQPDLPITCVNEFLEVWATIPEQYPALSVACVAGELIYAAQLYPEKRPAITAVVLESLTEHQRWRERLALPIAKEILGEQEIDAAVNATADRVEILADQLTESCDVLGLTTSFGQLFASIALARAVKERNRSIVVVLGGNGCRAGAERLLHEYPFVDYVIRGEGEEPLLTLLRGLARGQEQLTVDKQIISRSSRDELGDSAAANVCEMTDVDRLRIPHHDEYVEAAERHDLLWFLPIEGSRGCWWDRRARTGDPLHACHFCGINQSTMYRAKSPGRVASEMAALSERYKNTRFRFVDNVLRAHGGSALADAVAEQGRDYQFFLEIRASIDSHELLDLMEAGCELVQIGIEGLSTPYLRRLNKGTTTIQNLKAMRDCFELDISNGGNLLTGFPGATPAEVAQTREHILRYAIAFEPLNVSPFELDSDSPAYLVPEQFGITNVRNLDLLKDCLPERVWSQLRLPWVDYDTHHPPADWSPVVEACATWRQLHGSSSSHALGSFKPLTYFDGGTFLEITDRRDGLRVITLDDVERQVYLYCLEIRSQAQILAHLDGLCDERRLVDEVLGGFLAENLMFAEDGRYLSLAVAWRREAAMRRIRQVQRNARAMAATTPCSRSASE